MDITLDKVGKRYGRHWILRELSAIFGPGEIIGVRGRNGSGKSTLLRLLCGQLTPSRGRLTHRLGTQVVPPDELYRHVSWTGPYLELPEELTLRQFVDFHFGLKPLAPGIRPTDVLERTELAHVRNRKLSDCSSGMRQRVLLASALYADTPLLLLDEPTVTLDRDAVDWFHREFVAHRTGRLVVVASNDAADLTDCTRTLDLGEAPA